MAGEEERSEGSTLADHLGVLAADADDLTAMLTREHDGRGDIHPDALKTSERLATSLRKVIHALAEHEALPPRERLAMTSDDVWAMLTREHQAHDDGTVG